MGCLVSKPKPKFKISKENTDKQETEKKSDPIVPARVVIVERKQTTQKFYSKLGASVNIKNSLMRSLGSNKSSKNGSNVSKRKPSLLNSQIESIELEISDSWKGVSEANYPTLVTKTFPSKWFKYEKWLPVLTVPDMDVKIFVTGKWRMNEGKELIDCKGYSTEVDDQGKAIGSFTIRLLDSNVEIPINKDDGVKFSKESILLAKLTMGSFEKYIPEGDINIKLLGCRECSIDKIYKGYASFNKYVNLIDEIEVDEEARQVFFLIDSFRTSKESFMNLYLGESGSKKEGLEMCPKLATLTIELMPKAIKGSLNYLEVENCKQIHHIKGTLMSLCEKFPTDHDSPHLKVVRLFEKHKSHLLNAEFSKMAIGLKRSVTKGCFLHILLN